MNELFLKELLTTPGPSGDEVTAARIWRKEAESFADEVYTDVCGNSFAVLKGNSPRIMLTGHIDEIGLVIRYIDDEGFLSFSGIGDWDSQVLIGQRVRLLGSKGEVLGVIGKKPAYLLEEEDRNRVLKIRELWIDIGAKNHHEAAELVDIGNVGVIDAPAVNLLNGRLVSRAIDDRIGAFIILETLRLLAQNRPTATIIAVATSQEEITKSGARTSAFSVEPQIALAVDVSFATDYPECDKKQHGDIKIGGGPIITRGSINNPVLYQMLINIAKHEKIPYSIEISPEYTGTDADVIQIVRGGIAVGCVSVPCRYIHSPNEMIELSDVEDTIKLLDSFARSSSLNIDFNPC